MFRFAILVLAGIGLGALLFGGASGVATGVGFLALFPLFLLLKIAFIAMIFGVFAGGRRYRGQWSVTDYRPPWRRSRGPGRESSEEKGTSATDRFEEWHRMAHAREEVAGWADEPE
jgi:hypothetical protein